LNNFIICLNRIEIFYIVKTSKLNKLNPKEDLDDFFKLLHKEFNDAEILELGMMIGQYLGFGRLLKVLNLENQ
jgi:alkylhydroperoxidase family enzyme